jgi:MoCo/4Fe-4S cofactor protein with predicted Tat translocation signal
MSRKPISGTPLDLAALRKRLAGAPGPEYWRSLEELAGTPEFEEFLHREFPENASEWLDPKGRREFLKLMAASLALAGVSGCSTAPPVEKIVPYVRQPEEMIPGKPLFFATAATLGGIATGVLVESHLGRPTKIEGNPEHPASLGSTDAFTQAAILTLYDPERAQVATRAGRISTWSDFLNAFARELEAQRLKRGAGLRILTETVTSPTLAAQLRQVLREFPAAKWHQYEPAGRDNAREGARLAFGEYVDTIYRFDRADVILSLDSDFLCSGPGAVRYARDFASRRRGEKMNRLYVAESRPSNTGAMADHRLPFGAAGIGALANELAHRLGIAAPGRVSIFVNAAERKWIETASHDLEAHRGACLVVPGEHQPPVVHALCHAINAALGNVDRTVSFIAPVEAQPLNQTESLAELAREMEAGVVDVLVILDANPVYTAPADLEFARHLSRVPFRAQMSLYADETSQLCHWHIPESHFLESWGDAKAFDGTVSIQQPLIAPLYTTVSKHELLAAMLGQLGKSSYDIVREYWTATTRRSGADFEKFWRRTVHDGVMAGTTHAPRRVTLRGEYRQSSAGASSKLEIRNSKLGTGGAGSGLEIVFQPDPTIYDGRFAQNGWLQELPKPLTKLTWDNAAWVSPALAAREGLRNGDVVELRYQGRTEEAPVWVMPGQPDGSVTVHLGYGRAHAGRIGTGRGFNAYKLRTSAAPWFADGLEIRKTGRRYPLATTQSHHSMEGRALVRAATLEEYEKHPHIFHEMGHEPLPALTIYPPHKYEGYAWGMAVDLSACNGCGACVVACQAENNIPIVGKTEVARGRAMHWIRVDRYYAGELDDPETFVQPVLCMHCENAPCEVVCPVAATVHSSEGLNDMVYNRCVGTRYCSNNCPYKVRRFNFLEYSDLRTPSLKLMRNPNVTVRTRGVMEKCTYCVQRINAARITAEKEGRSIRDGEISTACQAACPAQAIVFGNVNDPQSRVSQWKAEQRSYGLLAELNTRPRTSYLGRLRNPNPELEGVGSRE